MEKSPVTLICSNDQRLTNAWYQALNPISDTQCTASIADLNDVIRFCKPKMIVFHVDGQTHRIDEAVSLILEHEEAQVFVLDDNPSDEDGVVLLKAGVRGYANSSIDGRLLQTAVASIARGELWVSRRVFQRLVDELLSGNGVEQRTVDPRLLRLTDREREIAEIVAEGSSNKIVAARLNITERTVKAHLTSAFQKTGTRDRLGLSLMVKGEAPLDSEGQWYG